MEELLHWDREEDLARHSGWSDHRIIWLWAAQPAATNHQQVWLPAMEQQMADLHARYERACMEE